MSPILRMLLTFAIGLLFGYILYKLKVPGGILIGAMLSVALLNIFTGLSYMPEYAKLGAQMTAGAYIACTIRKEDLLQMKHAIKPGLILLVGLFVFNTGIAVVIHALTDLDWYTAFFCAVPGGISDMPIIAADMGGNAANVAVCQFSRMLVSLAFFPTLVFLITKKEDVSKYEIIAKESVSKEKGNKGTKEVILTLLVAVAFGVLGKISGMPAGTLFFSMVGVIVLKLVFDKAYLPAAFRRFAQVFSGAYIGCSVTKQDILNVRNLVIPIVVSIVGLFLACFVLGMIIHKTCNKSMRESCLITTPAGATEMALISTDMGVGSADVAVLQILRIIVVVSLFPQLIRLFVALVS